MSSQKIVSLQDRLKKINTTTDLDKQLNLSVAYAKRLASKARKAKNLAEKNTILKREKEALCVTRCLRLRYLDTSLSGGAYSNHLLS